MTSSLPNGVRMCAWRAVRLLQWQRATAIPSDEGGTAGDAEYGCDTLTFSNTGVLPLLATRTVLMIFLNVRLLPSHLSQKLISPSPALIHIHIHLSPLAYATLSNSPRCVSNEFETLGVAAQRRACSRTTHCCESPSHTQRSKRKVAQG